MESESKWRRTENHPILAVGDAPGSNEVADRTEAFIETPLSRGKRYFPVCVEPETNIKVFHNDAGEVEKVSVSKVAVGSVTIAGPQGQPAFIVSARRPGFVKTPGGHEVPLMGVAATMNHPLMEQPLKDLRPDAESAVPLDPEKVAAYINAMRHALRERGLLKRNAPAISTLGNIKDLSVKPQLTLYGPDATGDDVCQDVDAFDYFGVRR